MSGPRILVVDDHPTNVKLLRVVLQLRGATVVTAQSAEEAMSVMEAAPPALILMDVQLPGTDGLALTRRLRADPRYATVPIVAVTAYAMARDEAAALAAGCDAFVTKPIDTRLLGDVVDRLLEGART